mmetsp:Transcript_52473/g.152729  ORF Transcript_52473/g.152729 Transcript_52473/m.152729 type:complete len:373 (+) Transcript_52473:2556-3674(+)
MVIHHLKSLKQAVARDEDAANDVHGHEAPGLRGGHAERRRDSRQRLHAEKCGRRLRRRVLGGPSHLLRHAQLRAGALRALVEGRQHGVGVNTQRLRVPFDVAQVPLRLLEAEVEVQEVGGPDAVAGLVADDDVIAGLLVIGLERDDADGLAQRLDLNIAILAESLAERDEVGALQLQHLASVLDLFVLAERLEQFVAADELVAPEERAVPPLLEPPAEDAQGLLLLEQHLGAGQLALVRGDLERGMADDADDNVESTEGRDDDAYAHEGTDQDTLDSAYAEEGLAHERAPVVQGRQLAEPPHGRPHAEVLPQTRRRLVLAAPLGRLHNKDGEEVQDQDHEVEGPEQGAHRHDETLHEHGELPESADQPDHLR